MSLTDTIVIRMNNSPEEISNTSKKPYSEKTLLEKMKDSYHGLDYDDDTTRRSNFMSAVLFWFTAISELFVALFYAVDWYYAAYDVSTVYYIKVFSVFVFVNAGANWICTKWFSSHFAQSKDQPDLQKVLWDSHPGNTDTAKVVFGEKDKQLALAEYCNDCRIFRPPRTHHCKVCKRCILKRDHHCFLTGTCIGYWNQRYFIVLCFYVSIACLKGLLVGVPYLNHHYPNKTGWHYVLPCTIFQYCWKSQHDWLFLLMILQLWILPWVGLMCFAFFWWQMLCVVTGRTSHELNNLFTLRLHNGNTVAQRFRSVFGQFWLLNFYFPMRIVFPQTGDGKTWPHVQFYYMYDRIKKRQTNGVMK